MPKLYRVKAYLSQAAEWLVRADNDADAVGAAYDEFYDEFLDTEAINVDVIEELEDGDNYDIDVSENEEV